MVLMRVCVCVCVREKGRRRRNKKRKEWEGTWLAKFADQIHDHGV